MNPYLREYRVQYQISLDEPIFEPNKKITLLTKEKKPMRTALEQYSRGQPPYTKVYTQDHLDAETPIQEMAQIQSIVACVQHSSEHANTKIRQVHEQVDGHAL